MGYVGLSNQENLYNSFKEVRNEVNPQELLKKLQDYDIIIHAMWELCKSKGATEGDFEDAINRVIETRKKPLYENKFIVKCPKCSRPLQRMNSFQMKCMYCSIAVTVSPYAQYEHYDNGQDDKEDI